MKKKKKTVSNSKQKKFSFVKKTKDCPGMVIFRAEDAAGNFILIAFYMLKFGPSKEENNSLVRSLSFHLLNSL
jgi:hypothetical protein